MSLFRAPILGLGRDLAAKGCDIQPAGAQ